ncbi:hypothetical protein D3C73_1159600 [compost metagenome]
MTAFVRAFMRGSMVSTLMSSSSPTSARTGLAPAATIAPTVATNVFAQVMTSSPGPIPSARSARIKASVPELREIALAPLQRSDIHASNFATSSPSTKSPVARSTCHRLRIRADRSFACSNTLLHLIILSTPWHQLKCRQNN